jgi:AcrR family transcriptional regulator
MSPRGVAIPGIREQFFSAAARVLAREGPAGFSSRTIAREADVATGLLYRHFTDLDGFLAEFMADRGRLAAQSIEQLLARTGKGTVAGNVTEAALALESTAAPIVGLIMSQPSLLARLHAGHSGGPPPVLREIERGFSEYLERERKLGRVRAGADVDAIALALIGTWHHLVISRRTNSLRPAIAALITAVSAEPA